MSRLLAPSQFSEPSVQVPSPPMMLVVPPAPFQ